MHKMELCRNPVDSSTTCCRNDMMMVDHCNRNPWKIGKDKLSITKTHVQTGFAHEDRFVKPCNLVQTFLLLIDVSQVMC